MHSYPRSRSDYLIQWGAPLLLIWPSRSTSRDSWALGCC